MKRESSSEPTAGAVAVSTPGSVDSPPRAMAGIDRDVHHGSRKIEADMERIDRVSRNSTRCEGWPPSPSWFTTSG